MSQLLLFQDMGSTSGRDVIIDIHGAFYEPFIDSLNISTGEVKNHTVSWKETEELLGAIESNFDLTQVKAIVIRAMEYEVMTLKESYAFRHKCQEFCQKHGIFYFVGNDIHLNALAALLKTHTMVKEGEEVLIVMSKYLDLVFTVKLIRENGQYRYIGSRMFFNAEYLQLVFFGYTPKKVITLHNPGASERVIKEINELLQEYHPVILHQTDECELEKEGVIFKIAHLMGERRCVYDVGVACSQAWFDIRIGGECLISVIPNEVLPFEKSITISVDKAKTVKLFGKFEVIPDELLEEVKLSEFKTKKAKITLKIDINLFYSFTVEPVGKIVKPPSSTPKMRIVFFDRYFSVYLQNKNKEIIVEDFDGAKKIPICISFKEKKPLFGIPAAKVLLLQPEFAIDNLIHLSSISNVDSVDRKLRNLPLKIEKEGDSIMVTVDTFEGERRSTVQFLLALILKHALLLVKNEIGKKMEEIEVEFEEIDEHDILRNNVEEAGKLVNVKIVFD